MNLNTINKGIKIVPLLSGFVDCNASKTLPVTTEVCCYWCTEQFDNQPVALPEKKVGDTFFVKFWTIIAKFKSSLNSIRKFVSLFCTNEDKLRKHFVLENFIFAIKTIKIISIEINIIIITTNIFKIFFTKIR